MPHRPDAQSGYAGRVTLYLQPEPEAELDRLYENGDAASLGLAQRIEEWLDLLDKDPGSRLARQRRFAGVWAITVRQVSGDDWAIVWDSDGLDVDVRHIGPASFA